MVIKNVSIVLLLREGELKFYDALVKISRGESSKRLDLCLLQSEDEAENLLGKIRSIISINHLLTLHVYLCSETDVLKIMNDGKVYIVYTKTDSERAKQLAQALTSRKISIEEVIVDES